jgi:hypothetical protein
MDVMTYTATDPAQAVRLILQSVFFRSPPFGDTEAAGFHVSHPHSGTEIHFEAQALLNAALFIRRNASSHLQSLSVGNLQQMLVSFVSDQIERPSFECWTIPENVSFASHVSPEGMAAWTEAMSDSPIFSPLNILFLYPMRIADVDAPFRSKPFVLLPPEELPTELGHWYDCDEIKGQQHPPTPMHAGMPRQEVSCWLGVRSPIAETALRIRNAILGALALLPHPVERYQFTMGSMPKGHMSFGDRVTYHSGDPCTPSLGERLRIRTTDHIWLKILAEKLESDLKRDHKSVLALQYFYRAWTKDPATRVAPLCGALDALFGDADAATQAMISAVGPHLGSSFDATRAKRLAKLRAGVIHGGAPNIYEASVYHRYYVDYRSDPIRDLELATAGCLRQEVFGNTLIERPHTYAELLKQYTGVTI